MAAAVLGATSAERSGFHRAYPVLLVEPGETRVGGAARGLALFVGASGYMFGALRMVACVISRTIVWCVIRARFLNRCGCV